MKSRKAERCTDVMFKLAFYCLPVTVEDLNLQQRQIWRYKYFRYTIFCSPRDYFRYMIGARHDRAPNFSCPVDNGSYTYVYFFWVLSTIKIKFGQKLVCCMTNISNMFLAECLRLETSSRLFYDFNKMII